LLHVLRIVAIDRRQRDDGLDPLARDDRPQCLWILPGSAHQSAGLDHENALLGNLVGI
jgi:hypothetical protein